MVAAAMSSDATLTLNRRVACVSKLNIETLSLPCDIAIYITDGCRLACAREMFLLSHRTIRTERHFCPPKAGSEKGRRVSPFQRQALEFLRLCSPTLRPESALFRSDARHRSRGGEMMDCSVLIERSAAAEWGISGGSRTPCRAIRPRELVAREEF